MHKYAYSSFIINCRLINYISDERAWHTLQDHEAILKKLFNALDRVSVKLRSCCYFCIVGSRMIFCISGERDCSALQENQVLFGQMDRRTYIFMKSICYAGFNGIWNSVVAWTNTDHQQHNMSPQIINKYRISKWISEKWQALSFNMPIIILPSIRKEE